LVVVILALLAVVNGLDFAEDRSCGTIEAYKIRYGNATAPKPDAGCPQQGQCDNPSVRNACQYCNPLTIPLIVHVIVEADGSNPGGITASTITGAVTQLNKDYQSYGISFKLSQTLYHSFPSSLRGYSCLSAYGGAGDDWYYEIEAIKQAYAVTPSKAINIFVTCQDPSAYGTLLGIATFPWDPIATTSLGGLWMNADATGLGHKTLTHEMGHCLGLWHTFHGVDEITSCRDPCTEVPHSITDSAADLVGDFCADTPAAPRHYECRNPTGSDQCDRVSWGTTDINNFMSYTPDTCMDQFTDDQELRMHCWTCTALPGITQGC